MIEEYLGDGVYAVYDRGAVWLDCRAQPELSTGPTMHPGICLEREVLDKLNEFRKRAGL